MDNQSHTQKVLEYLDTLIRFKGTNRTGMEGFHDYYEQAGYAAERIREMGTTAVEGLILGLESDHPDIRHHAIQLLGQIRDRRAVEPLHELSKKEHNQRNRTLIEKTISQIGDPDRVNRLTADLQSDDMEIRLDAVRKLAKYKNQAVSALLTALQDSEEAVRNEAANSIGTGLTGNSQVVAPLIDMLQVDESPQVRASIAFALGVNTTQVHTVVLALLTHALDETNKQVRDHMLSALKSNPHARAIPTLIENLKHPELEAWITSILAVYSKLGLLNENNIDPVIEWMNTKLSSDEWSKAQIKSLNNMSSALAAVGSSKAIEPILKLIDVNVRPYSHFAIEHLAQIEDMQARTALETLLDSHDPDIRLKTLNVMSRNPSADTIQAMQDYAKRGNLSEKEQAIIQTVSAQEPQQDDPLQPLKDDMQSSNVQIRLKAIGKLGEMANSLPTLLDALCYDTSSQVRAKAADTIGIKHMRNPEIIPHLIEAMQTDPDTHVRANAIIGLAYHKTHHEQISEAVLEQLESETDIKIYDSVLYALRKHPNTKIIPFALDSITNPKLSLRVVELLKVYVRRNFVTKEMMAPAIEWMEGLLASHSGRLNKEQQAAVRVLDEILATLDTSGSS